MSRLAVKYFLKKVWLWIKTYWYVPALVLYTLVMVVVLRRDGSNVLDVLSITKESHKKELEALSNAHAEETRKRDEVIRKYNKIIEDVEKQHDSSMVKLDNEKRRRVKDLVGRHHDDPEQLTQLLKITFGIHYEED